MERKGETGVITTLKRNHLFQRYHGLVLTGNSMIEKDHFVPKDSDQLFTSYHFRQRCCLNRFT